MKKWLAGLVSAATAGIVAGQTMYDFSAQTLTGEARSLSAFKGQVVLIVNTASRCGFTKQYAGLQSLYETYKEQGLVIIGFPANNFMGQEPGTNQEIQQFCTTRFNITFPLFGKISVKGKEIHPLYAWLTTHPKGGRVTWNFNKFLIGRTGELVAQFGSRTAPDANALTTAIEQELQRVPKQERVHP